VNLLFDQNISPRILKILPERFLNCQQVRFVGLENASDFEIFQFARENDLAVVTFDSDFVDLNAMHGTPPKIIYLNTGNLTTKNITELLMDNILRINHYLDSESDEILELIKAP
jgi:predicted nuclease of predicted toxin-antitoxin system